MRLRRRAVTFFLCAVSSVAASAEHAKKSRISGRHEAIQFSNSLFFEGVGTAPVPGAKEHAGLARALSTMFRRFLLARELGLLEIGNSGRLGATSPRLHFARSVHAGGYAREVDSTIGCDFYAWDDDGGVFDWTYDSHIYAPDGTPVAGANEWASQKSGFGSEISVNLHDPSEGEYLCTSDWYIDAEHWPDELDDGGPTMQARQTLTYPVPSGEASGWDGWDGAYGKWIQTLSGAAGAFKGRKVHEESGGTGEDSCWFSGSDVPKFDSVTGGDPWEVDENNTWGDDYIGWGADPIPYYRDHGRAPCGATNSQRMLINRPGSSDIIYATNTLHAGITDTEIDSTRANADAHSKIY
jgi:hypothetical protein